MIFSILIFTLFIYFHIVSISQTFAVPVVFCYIKLYFNIYIPYLIHITYLLCVWCYPLSKTMLFISLVRKRVMYIFWYTNE